jgi:hypothetical protein
MSIMAAAPKSQKPSATTLVVLSTVNIYDAELDLTLAADTKTEVAKITDWLQYHIDHGVLKIV